MNKLNVYLSSGWFSKSQDEICTKLENYLKSKESINPYFPRHDGVKLEPGQFHDPNLRKRVFLDNVENIDKADFIVTNLDGREGFLDTGTVWEDGYAMAKGIPVIAYQDKGGKLEELIGAVSKGFIKVCTGLDELDAVIDSMRPRYHEDKLIREHDGNKVLYISPDNTEENVTKGVEVASVLVECYGKNFKWVDKLSSVDLSKVINTMFNDVEYMVAVIDDRHPVVSWMMGQAFARNIPVVSYTNYDHGVNIMLLCSILTHVKGIDNLKEVIQSIKREGINSLDDFDSSGIKAF